jgi:hypothetical protein
MDIEGNLRAYLGAREPSARYTSFDYCFNYFQEHRERNRLPALLSDEALQLSCLHLGFYLASWGMLRGSSELLQRSVRAFVPVIEVIATSPPEIWETDADVYRDGSCPAVFQVAQQIRAALSNAASDTLITKIMLGTFGCVPAFDTYFKKGFGAWTFGPKALRGIGEFYGANSEVIERHRVETLDFASGAPTGRRYTRAKVIDMIFFVAGGA